MAVHTQTGVSMRRFTTALLAGLLLLGVPAVGQAGASDAGASAGWTDPMPMGRNSADVDIATNRGGDMVAVWSTSTGVIRARYRPAGEPWGEVERVARGDWAHLYDGSVSLGGQGRATVLWQNDAGLQISDRRPGGTWRRDRSAPLVHEDPEGCGDEWVDPSPVMAADRRGTVFITWQEYGCDEAYSSFEHYAWRMADGTWTRLRDGGGGSSHHDVTFRRNGRAVVLSSTGGGLRVQTLRPGDHLGRGRILVAHGSYSGMDIESNGRGDLALVAVSWGALPHDHLVALTKPAGERWSGPHRTPVADRAGKPSLAVAADGTLVAGYLVENQRAQVFGQVGHLADNSWNESVPLSARMRHDVFSVDVAAGRGGAGVAIWNRVDWPRALSTHAALHQPGGSWKEPVRLTGSNDAGSATASANVVRSRDRFIAVFVRNAALVSEYRGR